MKPSVKMRKDYAVVKLRVGELDLTVGISGWDQAWVTAHTIQKESKVPYFMDRYPRKGDEMWSIMLTLRMLQDGQWVMSPKGDNWVHCRRRDRRTQFISPRSWPQTAYDVYHPKSNFVRYEAIRILGNHKDLRWKVEGVRRRKALERANYNETKRSEEVVEAQTRMKDAVILRCKAETDLNTWKCSERPE